MECVHAHVRVRVKGLKTAVKRLIYQVNAIANGKHQRCSSFGQEGKINALVSGCSKIPRLAPL